MSTNLTTTLALQGITDAWALSNSIIEGPNGKKDAGFNTSLADRWGRSLALHIFDSSNGGLDYTWSFDPAFFGFAPLEYAGSSFVNREISIGDRCVCGFDNTGFIIKISSTLFNQFLLPINAASLPTLAKNFFAGILYDIDKAYDGIAAYHPSPLLSL
ncbi:hypothetical protein N7454_011306 [Penicillium verhagenii]|nr:hypothetical protein N7454_011306 [Penicillium verhagenii]